MARAGEEDLKLHYTAEFWTHPPPQAAGTVSFAMDVDDVPAALGSWPDRIAALSRPQERDLRRNVQQIVDAVPLVPLLDDPVPQMVEQLPDVMRFFDLLLPVSEQVIEVPKILLDDVSMRTAVRDTQLVEVPTIVSWSLLQLITKQNVDIPVPGRGEEFLVLKVFFLDRVQQRCMVPWNAFLSGLGSRTLVLVCLVAAFKIFAQERVHLHLLHLQLVSMVLQMGLGTFFSHFSTN